MTLVIVLVALAVVLLASGGLIAGTRARRRSPTLPTDGAAPQRFTVPPVTAAPQPEPSPVLGEQAGRPVLRDRLGRARGLLAGYFDQVRVRKGIDEATFEELEEALILADVGVTTTTRVLGDLRAKLSSGALSATDPPALLQALQDDLISMFEGDVGSLVFADGDGPTVWLFVGVNGVGKTTTIGKLALREVQAGRGLSWRLVTRFGRLLESSSSPGPSAPVHGSSEARTARTLLRSSSTPFSMQPPGGRDSFWLTPPGVCTPR